MTELYELWEKDCNCGHDVSNHSIVEGELFCNRCNMEDS